MNLSLPPKPISPDIHRLTTHGIAADGYDNFSHDDLQLKPFLTPNRGEWEPGGPSLSNGDEEGNDRDLERPSRKGRKSKQILSAWLIKGKLLLGIKTSSNTQYQSVRTSDRPDGNTDQPETERQAKSYKSRRSKHRRMLSTTATVLSSVVDHIKLILFLLVVPVALIVAILDMHPAVTFTLNLIATIPLSIVLTMATEGLARSLGPTIGAMLNVSAGNLAEMTIFVTALTHGRIRVVQLSLLGSMLVNLLLVLGASIFVGGLSYHEQAYNSKATQLYIGLLNLTVFSLLIPTAFYWTERNTKLAAHAVITFSRAISIMLLLVYALHFLHQLKSPKSVLPAKHSTDGEGNTRHQSSEGVEDVEDATVVSSSGEEEDGEPKERMIGRSDSTDRNWSSSRNPSYTKPSLGPLRERSSYKEMIISLVLLVGSTLLIGLCADYLIDGFRSLNEQGALTEVFTGLIILPVAGNVAELITGVTVAAKNQMDLAVHIGVGSAIQIGLFVTPVMVLTGWSLHQGMSLHFSLFETVTLVASVFTVNFLILRGKTFGFEGVMMMACFLGIAIGAFLLPPSSR